MKTYLYWSLSYFAAAVLIVLVSRDSGLVPLHSAWESTVRLVPVFGKIVGLLVLAGIALTALTRVQSMRTTVLAVLMAFVGTLFFHSGFTLVKTSMPYINPFYADPMLAHVDNVLHGGVDPWIWTHWLAEFLPMDWIIPFYLSVWAWPAICLPVIIAATDSNPERVKRTIIMFMMAWILIGNAMALGGMSAGPVYYDRLLDGVRFAALTEALAGAELGRIAEIQESLWRVYVENGQAIGSGISAFPSVHVSIAVVTMLYMIERSKFLAPIGIAFVAIILFLSVYTGYHYALDGYVSIIVMTAVWVWLRRPARATQSEPQGVPQAA